jgi:hypothetical protein
MVLFPFALEGLEGEDCVRRRVFIPGVPWVDGLEPLREPGVEGAETTLKEVSAIASCSLSIGVSKWKPYNGRM